MKNSNDTIGNRTRVHPVCILNHLCHRLPHRVRSTRKLSEKYEKFLLLHIFLQFFITYYLHKLHVSYARLESYTETDFEINF